MVKHWWLFFCLLSVLVYSIYYFPRAKFEGGAYFGGDTWAYQSWAVNLVKGHGLKFGGIESYETYKFSPGYGAPHNAGVEGYEYFMKVGGQGGVQDFWGTPGYSIFLGAVYKIFGINPGAAKQVQLLLLIIVAGFLPYIGFVYWEKVGFVSGIIAGAVFLNKYAVVLPRDILTEPFIVFMIFLTIVYTIVWQKNKTWFHALVLGMIISYDLLVKGSLVYVSFMYLVYFVVLWRKRMIPLLQVILLFVGICSIAVSWSIYGSQKLGRPVFLTTQDDLILTMGNNERSMNGEPYMVLPEDDSYYNKPEVKKMPIYLRIITFYLNHREMIPGVFINKIYVGFEGLAFFKIAISVMIFETWYSILSSVKKKKIFPHLITIMILGMTVFLLLSLFRSSIVGKYLPVISDGINISRLLILLMISLGIYFKIKGCLPSLPVPMVIFVANFLLITLMTFGFSRYVLVIAFITILAGVNYLLLFLIRLYRIIFIGVGGIKENG